MPVFGRHGALVRRSSWSTNGYICLNRSVIMLADWYTGFSFVHFGSVTQLRNNAVPTHGVIGERVYQTVTNENFMWHISRVQSALV